MKTWTIEILENQNIIKDYFDSINRPYQLLNKFDSLKYEIEKFDKTDIIYGSLYTLNKFNKKYQVNYYDLNKLKCSYYYSFYGKYLLNSDYLILPTKDVLRRKDWLFSVLGIDNTIYSRPDRPDKVYSGAPVTYEQFDTDMGYILSRGIRDDDLIIFSSPKNIINEYRCFIVNKKVITSSQYYKNGKLNINKKVPQEVINLAEEIAESHNLFDCFVIDIGNTKTSGYKLIEVNAMPSSGLYGCDPKSLVEAIDNT